MTAAPRARRAGAACGRRRAPVVWSGRSAPGDTGAHRAAAGRAGRRRGHGEPPAADAGATQVIPRVDSTTGTTARLPPDQVDPVVGAQRTPDPRRTRLLPQHAAPSAARTRRTRRDGRRLRTRRSATVRRLRRLRRRTRTTTATATEPPTTPRTRRPTAPPRRPRAPRLVPRPPDEPRRRAAAAARLPRLHLHLRRHGQALRPRLLRRRRARLHGQVAHLAAPLGSWPSRCATFALSHPVGAGPRHRLPPGRRRRPDRAAGCGSASPRSSAPVCPAALLVTVSWKTVPVYDAPDIIYLAAWCPLVIAGRARLLVDGRLAGDAWRRLGPRSDLWDLRRYVLRRGRTDRRRRHRARRCSSARCSGRGRGTPTGSSCRVPARHRTTSCPAPRCRRTPRQAAARRPTPRRVRRGADPGRQPPRPRTPPRRRDASRTAGTVTTAAGPARPQGTAGQAPPRRPGTGPAGAAAPAPGLLRGRRGWRRRHHGGGAGSTAASGAGGSTGPAAPAGWWAACPG